MHHHHQREGHGPEWRFASRRGGFGAFGRGFGPFGPNFGKGGGPFGIGRMLAGGDLRLVVLALLAEAPSHGYEIIKALEEKSSGFYSPSPGVIYPTLTFLEEAGYVTAATEGNKKVYSITQAGRDYLTENRDAVDSVLAGIAKLGKKIAAAREWFDWSGQRGERSPPTDRDIPGVVEEMNEARRTLKMAIAEKLDASEDEQRRVAGILRDAATAIREGGTGEKPEDSVDL
jgi:DNA-binding PadR family transcriptional regulator